MRCAALNTGPDFHLLDHIAPLAALMRMPLITTEELNQELACRYYPQVEIRHMSDLEFQLGALAEQFDVLFECKYWAFHLKSLFKKLYKKDMRLVFCPHGQSDKGFNAPLLSPYATQDAVLLYGELLVEMLKDLEIWPSISNHTVIGNYRLHFYEKHRSFYDALVGKEVPLNKKKRTLLYAPTWRDADGATSFFDHGSKVISQLPADWNLIIKLHPLLEQRDPATFYSIAALADKKQNAFLIQEFPPVYPLLSRVDVYLGDYSSIGYDLLAFQKPMFFFRQPHMMPVRLHDCGTLLDPEAPLFLQIEKGLLQSQHFLPLQKLLYQKAFAPVKDVKEAIEALLGGAVHV